MTSDTSTAAAEPLWRRPAVQLGAALLVGLLLRLPGLGDGLDHDEAYTWEAFASRSVATVTGHYPVPNNHILHTLLVQASAAAFGDSEPALRLPALAAGVLAIAAVWWLARAVSSAAAVPVVAAWVLALSPVLVDYSQRARGYTLLVLLSAVAGGALLRAQLGGRRVFWPLYAAALFGAIYTQPSAVLLAIGLAGWSLARAIRERHEAPGLLTSSLSAHAAVAVAAAAAYLPILGQVLAAGEQWGVDLHAGGFAATLGLLKDVVLACGLAVVGFALLGATRLARAGNPSAGLVGLLAAAALVPLIYGVAPQPRGFLYLLPWLAVWSAVGLQEAGSGWRRPAATAALLLSVGVQSVAGAITHEPDPGWREVGERLEARTPRGEVLVAPFRLDVELQHYAAGAIQQGVVTTLMDGESRSLLFAAQPPRFDLEAYTLAEDVTGQQRTVSFPPSAFEPVYTSGDRVVYRLRARPQSVLPDEWQWNAHPDEVADLEFGGAGPAVSETPGLAVRNGGGKPFRLFSRARFQPPGPGLVLLLAARTDPRSQVSLYRLVDPRSAEPTGEQVSELNMLVTGAKPVQGVGRDGRLWHMDAWILPVAGEHEYGVYVRGTAAPRQDFADIRVFFYPVEERAGP